jgi:aspartyl protease family protein
MPESIAPDWSQIALWAVGAAIILTLITRIPVIGRLVRFAISFSLLAFCIYLLLQQAPYEPTLARLAAGLGLDQQEVRGEEVRIRMSPDGHFWARVAINGHEARMLVDSGASVTALSERTARAAGVDRDTGVMPVVLRTANGAARADTGTIERLDVGGIAATGLKTVISPTLGNTDVLGMNFLSRLASWRVEGRTLVMVPEAATARPDAG